MSAQLEDEVMSLASEGTVTVEEISKKLRTSWPRTHSILSKLTGEGKLIHERKGRMNLYRIPKAATDAPSSIQIERHPQWVKAKDLDKLSKEIKDYWSAKKSAQDIVEAQRRSV